MVRFGVAHADFDAWDMAFLRYVVAGLILAPYFIMAQLPRVPAKGMIIMLLGLGVPYMLVVASGLKIAPVQQFAAVTPASMIAFSLLLGLVFLHYKVQPAELVGVVLILLGIALVVYFSAGRGALGWRGYLFFLLGGFMWAMYTVAARHYCQSALHATVVVYFFSMLLYAPLYLAWRGGEIFSHSPGVLWVQVFYQGFFASLLALFCFSKAVFILGPAVGAVFAALVPAVATVFSAVFLGEQPHAYAVGGIAIITLGMVVTVWRGRVRRA